jgi:NitT/TauT family transport system substrate-binding protein
MTSRKNFVLASSAALGAAALPDLARAQANAKLTVGAVSRTAVNWVYEIAGAAGFFEREKLAVDFIFTGNNAQTMQQLVANSTDLAATTIETSIRAIDNSAPTVMVASYMLKFPYTYVAAPSIAKPADLKGKKVIMDLQKSFLTYSFHQWMHANKLGPDDVDFVFDGSSTDRMAALASGSVVVAALTQPLDLLAIEKGYKKLFDLSQIAKDVGFTAVTANKTWLGDPANVAKLRAFVRAQSAATTFFYDRKNRDQCVNILANFSKVDPAIAAKTYDYFTTDLHPFAPGAALGDAWVQGDLNYLSASGDLPTPPPPVSKYVDHRFAPK